MNNPIEELLEAVKVQLQLIKALIASKRVVNLDESISYYEKLVEKYDVPSSLKKEDIFNVDKIAQNYTKGMLEFFGLELPNQSANTVKETIKNIPQQSQVQYDMNQQLFELKLAANKLGLYDAADFITNTLNKK